MALSIPDPVPFRAPQGVHLLLSVGIPTVFSWLAVYWVTGLGPSWTYGVLALVYTVLMAFWATWRFRSHQGNLIKAWVWLALSLTYYGATALVEALPWPRTFGLEGYHLAWFLVGFCQGQLALLWSGQLAPRARLFQLLEGIPEGKELEDRVRDFQIDADFTRANQTALTTSLVALGACAACLAAASPYGTNGLSTGLLAGFLALCLLTGVLLRTYRREMEALMYGFRFRFSDKLAPLGWSLVLMVLAGLGSWGFMALGGPWFDWSILNVGHPIPVPAPEPPPMAAPLPDLDVQGGDYRLRVLLALLGLIFRVGNISVVFGFVTHAVVWVAPWVLGAFLLWPLVRWFLSGGRETKGLWKRWIRMVQLQGKAFWGALQSWWKGGGRTVLPGVSIATPGAREWVKTLFGFQHSGPRKPYPDVVEAFLSLVRWSRSLTTYHPGETTREFLDRLVTLVPDRAEDLARIRDLLDEELFGPQGLDSDGRKEFRLRVASVVSQPASHGSSPGVS